MREGGRVEEAECAEWREGGRGCGVVWKGERIWIRGWVWRWGEVEGALAFALPLPLSLAWALAVVVVERALELGPAWRFSFPPCSGSRSLNRLARLLSFLLSLLLLRAGLRRKGGRTNCPEMSSSSSFFPKPVSEGSLE